MNKPSKGYQFGTFKGVFTPSILTILGVIMYLRFGWVLGQLGLISTLVVVTLACSVTFLTGLSIAQLATNMRVGGGGAYYIISRTLGLEAGAAIGLPLFFAQALGISFYVFGFSTALNALFPHIPTLYLSLGSLCVITLLAFFSADLALKMQYVILALIVISLASFFLGQAPDPSIVVEPVMLEQKTFWYVFAVFFPAVTGIEAGLSMSGDLKDPERALPRGIISVVLFSFLIYLAIPIFLNSLPMHSQLLLTNDFIMRDVARWGDLILAGLLGAALSSALGALLGAPRTLQALANDGVLPRWIGKGVGKQNQPRMATFISFGIAFIGICLGDLNAIATLLTMFFLMSYGLLNLAAALEGMIASPSWRPKFHLHWIWSLLGFLICISFMFLINAPATFVAFVIIAAVFYIIQKRQLHAYWGDMQYGIWMLIMRLALYKVAGIRPNEKTWRPDILVLSGSPTSRWHLIELGDAISHGKGFLTVASIVSEAETDISRLDGMEESVTKYLKEKSVPAVVKVISDNSVMEGAKSFVQSYGYGPLSPNTVLVGESKDREGLDDYLNLLDLIVKSRKNLIIVQEKEEDSSRGGFTIDLWWSHVGKNAGLMLALAYLLKTSPEWEGANLVIKTIVDDDDEKAKQLEYFKSFIAYENLQAEIEVYYKEDKDPFAIMQEKSKNADIVFVGMKPMENQDEYKAYYTNLMDKASNFPTTAFVLASEDVDFSGIFQLRQ